MKQSAAPSIKLFNLIDLRLYPRDQNIYPGLGGPECTY